MTRTNADAKIDSYLARTRARLRGLSDAEIEDILRELRSHVVDLAGDGLENVDAALQSLGDPVDLAKPYLAEHKLIRAECSGSPLVILQGLRHAARTGAGRITATALYAFGYINVLTLWSAAIKKLFQSASVGLWYVPGSISLGWWFVPVAVLAGLALRWVVDNIARWWIRRYRRAEGASR